MKKVKEILNEFDMTNISVTQNYYDNVYESELNDAYAFSRYKEDAFKTLHFGKKTVFFRHSQELFRNAPANQQKVNKKHHQTADECRFITHHIKKEQNDAGCINHYHYRCPGSKKVYPAYGAQQDLCQMHCSFATVKQR